MRKQLELDREDMAIVPVVATKEELCAIDIGELWSAEDGDDRKFWDDVSGKVLDSALTKAARQEEIKEAERMGVWVKVDRSECMQVTGRGPIGTRWVDTNKRRRSTPTSTESARCKRVEQR